MANKYDDVAFFAALVMECTGVHDDQMYALTVYDHLLNICNAMPAPSHECAGIVSPQLFYPRQLWYHRTAPLIEDHRTNRVFAKAVYRQQKLELMRIGIYVDRTHIRRQKITSEMFWTSYSNIGKPVVLEKLIPVSFFKRFSLNSLAKRFANNTISVSKSQHIVPRQFVEDCRVMLVDCDVAGANDALFFQERIPFRLLLERLKSFKQGVDFQFMDEREYLFGPLYRNRSEDTLDRVYDLRRLFEKISDYFPREKFVNQKDDELEFFHSIPLFYVGSERSYTYWHSHNTAVNILFSGMKKWYLLPPNSYFGPKVGSMSWWLKHVYNDLPIAPLEVIQHPGDVMFVPSNWNHAVINLESVSGITFQLGEI